MAGAMPELRRVEHHARRSPARESARREGARGRRPTRRRFHDAGRTGIAGAAAARDRVGGARPGAGRRSRAGFGDLDRRRPRHWEIDVDAARPPPRSTSLGTVLYATGEESVKQVALRARRLGLEAGTSRLIAETSVEAIVAAATTLNARALIVDSIQTMYSERIDAAPGAVSQLRECTAELVRFAKTAGTAVLLIRSCHQGRTDRRATRARAHGRYRAVLREQTLAAVSGCCVRSKIVSVPPTRSACSQCSNRACAR